LSRSVLPIVLCLLVLVISGCGGSSAPQPAARVNGYAISMATYSREVNFKRRTDSIGGVDVCLPKSMVDLCHKLKQTVLSALINNEIVNQYARSHGITISAGDFNRQWAQVFKSKFHGDAAVLRDYARGIGFTVPQIKQTVQQDLMQKAVLYRITKNMPTSGAATTVNQIATGSEAEMQQVMKLLKKGVSFESIARALVRKKGEVCYRSACGISLVLPDAFVPKTESSVVTARPGTTVGPFSSQQALTLVLVQAHYQMYPFTAQQVYSLRQQRFGAWLAQQVRRSHVQRFATT
jgi:SurA N-terminal domain